MWTLNRIVGTLLDLLLAPFRGLPAAVGLTVIAVLVAVPMLLVFKWTSDQPRVALTKRRMTAAILEIRLFNDQPRLVLAAQADVLRQSLRYIRLTLVPLLWMALPLIVVIAHLQSAYGYRGLRPGETAIVKVRFAGDERTGEPPFLEAGDGLRVETPPVMIESLGEADWRIAAVAAGEHDLTLRLANDTVTKSVVVSGAPERVSVRRPRANLWQQLLYPAEQPLPRDSGLSAVEIRYPERTVNLFGWQTHWLIAFFILTIVAALALRRPLRVNL